jgi:polyhydroxyalkanoate synthase
MFVVGTERDHVAPWQSVYKIHQLTDGDLVFVLTSGGHNAGIVSEPGHKGRRYRIAERRQHDPYLDPQEWVEAASAKDGSWWLEWSDWLLERSTKERVAPPSTGAAEKGYAPLEDAPGTYVFQR